jgi:hypothetical protein
MQTFLPSASFRKSAKILDNRRLGKQRVEAYQILQCLLGVGSFRWKHHPAVKMWKDYEPALFAYMVAMCNEWKRRGFKNTKMDDNTVRIAIYHLKLGPLRLIMLHEGVEFPTPFWLGNRKFHAAHRSNLLRKDKIYYKQFKWKERNNLPYIWPVESPANIS